MYVCGITPYDATHLGHAFTYTTFDLIHRAWLDAGHQVDYVQNVTDIDDPLLERAVATGEDWRALADRETALFRTDMAALRVLPPTWYVGAVESMDLVVDAVGRLDAAGAVYRVEDDLYFSVAADRRFGGVARLDEGQMEVLCGQRGGDPDRAGKRNPLDPLLWQAARPDEPAWDTALGHGRPGWHVECTAIALAHLGMSFDVQGGGSDLAYPHHEMCASLAHVATGSWPFARRFVHAGMVGLDGEKMSKSRGNLVFVSRLLADGVSGTTIRAGLLDHHYRHDWEWAEDDLARAERARATVVAGRGRPGRTAGRRTSSPPCARRSRTTSTRLGRLRALDRWADGSTDARATMRQPQTSSPTRPTPCSGSTCARVEAQLGSVGPPTSQVALELGGDGVAGGRLHPFGVGLLLQLLDDLGQLLVLADHLVHRPLPRGRLLGQLIELERRVDRILDPAQQGQGRLGVGRLADVVRHRRPVGHDRQSRVVQRLGQHPDDAGRPGVGGGLQTQPLGQGVAAAHAGHRERAAVRGVGEQRPEQHHLGGVHGLAHLRQLAGEAAPPDARLDATHEQQVWDQRRPAVRPAAGWCATRCGAHRPRRRRWWDGSPGSRSSPLGRSRRPGTRRSAGRGEPPRWRLPRPRRSTPRRPPRRSAGSAAGST